jgi:hypothetical protein
MRSSSDSSMCCLRTSICKSFAGLSAKAGLAAKQRYLTLPSPTLISKQPRTSLSSRALLGPRINVLAADVYGNERIHFKV